MGFGTEPWVVHSKSFLFLLTNLFAQSWAQDGPSRGDHCTGLEAALVLPSVEFLQRKRRHKASPTEWREWLLRPVHCPQPGLGFHLTQKLLGTLGGVAMPRVGNMVFVGTDVVLHGTLQPRTQHAGRHTAPPEPLHHRGRLGEVIFLQIRGVTTAPLACCSPHPVPDFFVFIVPLIFFFLLPTVVACSADMVLVLCGLGGSLPTLSCSVWVRTHIFCTKGGPGSQALWVQVVLVAGVRATIDGVRSAVGAAASLQAELWGGGAGRRLMLWLISGVGCSQGRG